MSFKFEIKGNLFQDVKNLVDNKDMTRFYKQAGAIMMKSVRDNFQAEGRYNRGGKDFEGGSDKWTDLSDLTKLSRSMRGKYPGRILQVTGMLRNSISYEASNDGVRIFSAAPAGVYGHALQYGADITQTVTPKQRKFFWYMHYTVNKIAKSKRGKGKSKQRISNPAFMRMALAKQLHIKLPPRPFLVIQPEDYVTMAQAYFSFMNQ